MKSAALKVLFLGFLAFNIACDPKPKESLELGSPVALSESATGIAWNYSSGSYFSTYQLDFQLRTLQITIHNSGTATPSTKSISDSQIAEIKSLLAKIHVRQCDEADSTIIGGANDSISVFTNSTTTSSLSMYGAGCNGRINYIDSQVINLDAYYNLRDYIKAL